MKAPPPDPDFPAAARVVIIGGGVMGCGLAYHLCQAGWSDLVLLEKAELTSGSTWHAAGQVGHSTSDLSLAKIAQYASQFYPRMEAETGQSCTWHGCGSLRIAYEKDEVDWLRHTISVGRGLGIPMEIVGPAEIRKLHPFYNTEGILAALHTPADGHVDPAGAAFAMAKGARAMGAKIIRRCRATSAERAASGEWLVKTERGDIRCEHLVNAGGAYARQICEWVGLEIPVANLLHTYFVTEPVPEFADLPRELPVIRDDRKVSGYIRMEQKSGLIGIYEKRNQTTAWDDGAPWDSESELFDADYDAVSPWLENAMERMPILATRGIRRAVRGVITHPPDGNMILGPAPGRKNFWLCCGSQVGIAWGPGAGKYLAEWMTTGAADISMRAFDPRRFGKWANGAYRLAKGREDYSLRHEIPYPRLDRPAARPVKVSPLHEEMKARGAVMEQAVGWERPMWFAGGGAPPAHIHSFRRAKLHKIARDECRALREKCAVADMTAFGKLEIRGAGAFDFLERMCANAIPRSVGGMALGHFLTENGRVEFEAAVARLADGLFYLTCAADRELAARDWLAHHLREDAEIVNVSDDFCVLALAGPESRKILSQTTDAALDNESFPWLTARTIQVGGRECRALRVSYAGELGWELHIPNGDAAAVYQQIISAGGDELTRAGSLAFNCLRMEKGYPSGAELTNEVTMTEAGLGRFMRLDKDYIGAEINRAEQESGPQRWALALLEVDESADAGLAPEDAANAETGDSVWAGGKTAGIVSSAGYGHCVEKGLAFAYVSPQFAKAGTELEILILGEMRKARVLPGAPFDPENKRPRS